MLGEEDPLILCATQTDKDFNAEKLGSCNEHCHRQRKSQVFLTFLNLNHFFHFELVYLHNCSIVLDLTNLQE